MKTIVYRYSNGKTTEHTRYIKSSTIKRESEGSKTCNIYEKSTRFEAVCFGIVENQKEYVTRYKFITTLILN